jgi:ribosomal protein S18 acetylase RimI-like enzyme
LIHNSIRPLERADLERVAFLVDVNEMFPSEMLLDMTAGHFAGETGAHRWIVFDDGTVQAAAYYRPEPLTEGTWNVLMIAVDPAEHGCGIGTQLMRFIEQELAGEGIRVLLVETSGTADFKRTRGFYDMLGYEREARIRDYYAEGDDKVIFRKAF